MKPLVLITFVILLLLAVTACAPSAPATEENIHIPPAASTESYHPFTTQTGIQTIDSVLEAVESSDPQALHSQVEFLTAPCTKREGFGGPPKCLEGEAEGTPVEGLAFLDSEGGILRRDEIENWQEIQAVGVYAVYEVNAAAISSEQYYPIGKYVIILVDKENRPAIALRIGEKGIVRVDTIFDASLANLDALIEREASTIILSPKS